MEHKNGKRASTITMILILTVLIFGIALLTACRNNTTEEVQDATVETISKEEQKNEEKEDERITYITELREENVLKDVQENLRQDTDIETTYSAVDINSFDEMKAWETDKPDTNEDASPTYLFIAKLGDGADAASLSEQLLTTTINRPGMDENGVQLECASCGGFLIMAGAKNGSDIVNKFSQVVSSLPIENVDDIFEGLQSNLGKT